MGRLPCAIDDGLVYHALNRGNNRARVFANDDDHLAFLQALATTKERYPFRLFGYCLMSNHFHLLLRPEPGQSISRILQSLTVAHTWRYHRRYRSSGHVWQARFKSPVIQDDMHLLVVLRYIEAKPLRAPMVVDPADYRWSSFPHHGIGRDDPLLSSFPEWEELGRTEAAAEALAGQSTGCPRRARVGCGAASLRSGRPLGAVDWTERMAERLGIELNQRPRGRTPQQKCTDTN